MELEALDLLERFDGVHVLCVGDAILDRYVYGDATRISPEAPVPVVHVKRQTLMAGGAGNVSRNLFSLGVVPHLTTVVGDDANSVILGEHLAQKGCPDPHLIRDSSRPTIVKTRIIAGIQQVVRFDEESPIPLAAEISEKLLAAVDQDLASVAAVAVSDYAKGVVAESIVCRIIELAHKRGKPVAIDPKGNDYSRYSHADLIKPNRKELGEAVGSAIVSADDVDAAARMLMDRYDIKNVLVTLSEKGMALFSRGERGVDMKLLPSRAQEIFDVSGAGDTVLAVMAAAMAVPASLELGARLATVAAGVVVGKVGTAVATRSEIKKILVEQI